MKSKIVALRISHDLRDKLLELATQDRRTFSAYVRIALEDHVSKSVGRNWRALVKK